MNTRFLNGIVDSFLGKDLPFQGTDSSVRKQGSPRLERNWDPSFHCASSPNPPRVLIAGIGNVFRGDDGFGMEVVRQLQMRAEVSDEVCLEAFGVRSHDLAYAINGDHEAVILAVAAEGGLAPGTLCLLELDLESLDDGESFSVEAHSMDLISVLRLARSVRKQHPLGRLFMLCCEPASLKGEDYAIQLSPTVQSAVSEALEMIRWLLADHFGIELETDTQHEPHRKFTGTHLTAPPPERRWAL